MIDHHNSPDLEIKCFECKREFQKIYNLQSHINTVHSIRQKVTCDICGLTYADKYSLARNRFDFNLKKSLVDHSLKSKLSHVKDMHSEKNIDCPQCDKKFSHGRYSLIDAPTNRLI